MKNGVQGNAIHEIFPKYLYPMESQNFWERVKVKKKIISHFQFSRLSYNEIKRKQSVWSTKT